MNLMLHTKNIQTTLMRWCTFTYCWCIVSLADAQIYNGGGIQDGIDEAGTIVGSTDLREKIISILRTVLSYMALAAVVVIVIAGIRLVISGGEEDVKEKARRSILYTVVGLIIILVARSIVEIVASIGA